MNWIDIDKMFHRAFHLSFSKKKFLFTYPLLALCGLFIAFFHTLSKGSGDFLRLSFSFFPVFIASSFLLAAGIVLVRAYHNEIKQIPFSYRDLLQKSWDLIVASLYLTAPLPMAYVTLWSVIGFFYLLKEIPWMGVVIGLVFSFVPFLLILSFLALAILSVALVFFLAPTVALRSQCSYQLIKELVAQFSIRSLSHITLLLLALIPVSFVFGVLTWAGSLTASSYVISQSLLSISAQQCVTSLAFSALCTPIVVFFFNFSAEAYIFLKRTHRAK